MTEQEERSQICAKILWLQDKATAASRACAFYMSVDHHDNKKYLAALREHGEYTREINQLKKMLDEAQS